MTIDKYNALKKMNPNLNPVLYSNGETAKREKAKQNIEMRLKYK